MPDWTKARKLALKGLLMMKTWMKLELLALWMEALEYRMSSLGYLMKELGEGPR